MTQDKKGTHYRIRRRATKIGDRIQFEMEGSGCATPRGVPFQSANRRGSNTVKVQQELQNDFFKYNIFGTWCCVIV